MRKGKPSPSFLGAHRTKGTFIPSDVNGFRSQWMGPISLRYGPTKTFWFHTWFSKITKRWKCWHCWIRFCMDKHQLSGHQPQLLFNLQKLKKLYSFAYIPEHFLELLYQLLQIYSYFNWNKTAVLIFHNNFTIIHGRLRTHNFFTSPTSIRHKE